MTDDMPDAPPMEADATVAYEPVGYRYRPANGAENVPRNRGGEWEYAPASDAEDMAVLAEKGWQVERLYRRVDDEN